MMIKWYLRSSTLVIARMHVYLTVDWRSWSVFVHLTVDYETPQIILGWIALTGRGEYSCCGFHFMYKIKNVLKWVSTRIAL